MPSLAEAMEVFWGLVDPWIFLYLAFSYLPGTILRLICAGDFRTLASWSRVRDAWFSAFWGRAGPNIRAGNDERIVALLEGRVRGGRVVEEPVHPPVGGVVLEIGPGSGQWVDIFSSSTTASSSPKPGIDTSAASSPTATAKAKLSGVRRRVAEGVKRVYGVEPNVEVHSALRRRVREAGLEGTYEIVPAGIESLSERGGIERGSVDCIVSILCLCSIPDPERNVAELYSYLKEGGRWYLYEHVETLSGSGWFIRFYQRLVNLVWPRALNGCQLCRNTGKTLESAGPWREIDVVQRPDEPWYQVVPHIFGTLVK